MEIAQLAARNRPSVEIKHRTSGIIGALCAWARHTSEVSRTNGRDRDMRPYWTMLRQHELEQWRRAEI